MEFARFSVFPGRDISFKAHLKEISAEDAIHGAWFVDPFASNMDTLNMSSSFFYCYHNPTNLIPIVSDEE